MKGWEALGYKTYKEYLQSERWINLSLAMREEAKETCEVEGCKEKNNLHVHHVNYENTGNESYRDVVLLCKKHHDEAHKTKNESLKKQIVRRLDW